MDRRARCAGGGGGAPPDLPLELSFVWTEIKPLHRSANRLIDAMLLFKSNFSCKMRKCLKDHTPSIGLTLSFLYHIFTLIYLCCSSDTDAGAMGLCALSPRLDTPTRIVDLEEILFSVVKNNHLTLAQRQCVGRSIYLEACNPGSIYNRSTKARNFCVCLFINLYSYRPLQVMSCRSFFFFILKKVVGWATRL